jgi:hypothetical protein
MEIMKRVLNFASTCRHDEEKYLGPGFYFFLFFAPLFYWHV